MLVYSLSLLLLSIHVKIELGTCSESKRKLPPFGKPMRKEFLIAEKFTHLNHGAYGTIPRLVLKSMHSYQKRAEKYPDLWVRRRYRQEMDRVRKLIAEVMNVDPENIVIIPNVTYGLNIILKSISFATGERILYFNTLYHGVRALIKYLIDRGNGTISGLVFNATYPISFEELLKNFESFLVQNQDSNRPIRVAVLEHITSVPGVIVPIEEMIPMLKRYNISIVIDAAHSIGHVPVDIQALDPDYYVTDCHKWMYVVRGFAVMYIRKNLQRGISPLEANAGYLEPEPGRFQKAFFWRGAHDYSSYMTLHAALQFIQDAGGFEEIMKYNHKLAREGGIKLATRLGTEVLEQEGQMGNMVDVRLPLEDPDDPRFNVNFWDDMFFNKYNYTYMKIHRHNGSWWARASAQIYLELSDFDIGAGALISICDELNNKQ